MSFENSFMQPEIVYGEWAILDGDCGIWIVPAEDAPETYTDEELDEIYSQVSEGGSECHECTYEEGFVARLSAPGYLDCTDWQGVYSSKEEALEELEEMYGD